MRAKLFRNGRSQAVRLPAACRFDGSEVEVQHDPTTGVVTLTPVRSTPLEWLRLRGQVLDGDPEASETFDALFAELESADLPVERPWP